MRKIRELLRLKYELGRSHREIAASLGIANSTVSDYVRRASAAGFSWPLPEGLDDAALETALFPAPPPSRVPRPEPDWKDVHRELQRHEGVTLHHRRDRVGKTLSRLCVRPPGLPPRHLDALLPRLPPPRRTHPRPRRRVVSQAHPAPRPDVAPRPRRLGARFALGPGPVRPPRGPRRPLRPPWHPARQPGPRRALARCRRRSHLRRRHPRPSPQQRAPDNAQGRIDEKALRLDEDRLHPLTSTLNPDPQRPYGPPLLQGDRHGLESAIGLPESVVGIAGIRSAVLKPGNVRPRRCWHPASPCKLHHTSSKVRFTSASALKHSGNCSIDARGLCSARPKPSRKQPNRLSLGPNCPISH